MLFNKKNQVAVDADGNKVEVEVLEEKKKHPILKKIIIGCGLAGAGVTLMILKGLKKDDSNSEPEADSSNSEDSTEAEA